MQRLLQQEAQHLVKSSKKLDVSTAATTANQLRMVRSAEDPENEEQMLTVQKL